MKSDVYSKNLSGILIIGLSFFFYVNSLRFSTKDYISNVDKNNNKYINKSETRNNDNFVRNNILHELHQDSKIFNVITNNTIEGKNRKYSNITSITINNNMDFQTVENISNINTKNQSNLFIFNKNSKIYNENQSDNTLKKIIIAISIYGQLFLIISTISLLKLYEEYFKTKSIFCENKYSHFKTLKDENKDILLDKSHSYVFCSGNPSIKREAEDNIFNFPKNKKFAKIERIVEIYYANEEVWKIIGKNNLPNINLSQFCINQLPYIYLEEDLNQDKYKLEINSLKETFTFPKIFSKLFLGEAELFNVNLSPSQLSSLKISELIKLPENNEYIKSFLHEIKIAKSFTRDFLIDQNENYLTIYPLEEQGVKRSEQWRMRIHLLGYPLAEASLFGQIYKNKFRTIYIPYNHEALEKTMDSSRDMNLSLGMITIPNFHFDLCNVFFCFCFSGPVIYKQDEDFNDDGITIGKINWLEEKILSKEEFIYSKHGIHSLTLHLTRLVFLGVLCLLFYYLPNPTYMFTRMLNISKDKVDNHYFLYSFLFAKIFTLFIIIYSKFSIKLKHLFDIFIMTSFIIALIIYSIWEVIYLAEYEFGLVK